MKVLLLTNYYLPGYKGGGPIKTLANLISTTSDTIEYSVVTSDRDLGDEQPYPYVTIGDWNKAEDSSIFYTEDGLKGLGRILDLLSKKNYNIIYLNSFFSIRFSLIPLLIAKIRGISIVLGPRGEFSEGALTLKAFKKKVYIDLYKFFKLKDNVVFQASSEFESNDIKKTLGCKVDVFIAEDIGSKKYVENIPDRKSEVLNIVFLSRISPMKNITYAIEILSKVSCQVSFDIYGPVEDKIYWEKCKELILKLPKNIVVNYKGSLSPDKVIDTLANYDLFLMPTKGENYGHVIAEALCAGLPILIANTTPWRDLSAQGIGWDISLDKPELFVQAIEEASAISAEQYQELRNNVLSWAKQKFDQRDAIDANIAMFRYAIDKE